MLSLYIVASCKHVLIYINVFTFVTVIRVPVGNSTHVHGRFPFRNVQSQPATDIFGKFVVKTKTRNYTTRATDSDNVNSFYNGPFYIRV